ncbi:regulatory signaling modulator protein AmpE [Methylonatrum kenyense]|uniref:regulatory signaling modulator protein AmpE n=1 Tax=Methylonatrum kenyense TaxID=455253 RepID=UPI0020C16878|nr:regulatory signaling modulator protein AmpE [Methylonatrum kenyense]MCK8516566.1 regulatory signaling modulator protein AmpE [Methylonatrum kenyense]
MDVIAILLALLICHYWPVSRDWNMRAPFLRYADWLQVRLDLANDWNRTLPVLLLLLPPVLLTALLQLLLGYRLAGIPALLFGVLVLLLCLPPLRADQLLSKLIRTLERSREDQAQQLVDENLPADRERFGETASEQAERHALSEGAPDLLALAFWFIVFGPFGAVAWRLADLARGLAEDHESGGQALRVWHDWLGWLPARLLLCAYGFMGSLQAVLASWRGLGPHVSNRELLDRSGRAALHLPADATPVQRLTTSRQLIRRALIGLFAALIVLKLILPI